MSPLSPVPCNRTLAGPEGWLVSPEPATVPYDGSVDCTYTVSVYPGYGVELKVSWGLRVGWGCQVPAGKRGPSPAPCCGCVATHSAANRQSCPCPRPCPHVPEPEEPAQGIAQPSGSGAGMKAHGLVGAPCPPAAMAGTHHGRSDAGFNYRSTDGESVSNAGGCDAVVQSQENLAPVCQEQRLAAAPAVLRPRVAPIGGTRPCIPTSARPSA